MAKWIDKLKKKKPAPPAPAPEQRKRPSDGASKNVSKDL